ncbi:TPA: sugar transferase, partial [Streptococcus suis]|nr:sugar transferase [Streptococcus suis]
QMNIWYANNISFWLDVKIFFTTIIKVLKNEDNINTNKTV